MALLPTSSYTPDASASVKGRLKLSGDLGGTATTPLVKRSSTFTVAPYGSPVPSDYPVQSATAADVAINAAIVAAAAAGTGYTVELLNGTFMTSAAIVPLSNVDIKGQGMYRTHLITTPGSTWSIFDNQGVYSPPNNPWSNSTLSDMEWDGSNMLASPSLGNKGLDGHGMSKIKIMRIYCHDTTATGLGCDYPYETTFSENIVAYCGFKNKRIITAASWSSSALTFTTSTPHGYSGTTQATGLLTASGSFSDGDTVTLGSVVYTYKTTLTGTAYEVLIGVSTATALANLKSAVNATAGAGTTYGIGTLVNQLVVAGVTTSTTQAFNAKNFGAGGNALATTTTSAGASFGSSTLTGGTTSNRVVIAAMLPIGYNGIYNVSTIVDAFTFTIDAAINNAGTLTLPFNPGTATQFGTTSDFNIGQNGIGIASGGLPEESVIVTNNICIGNQDNNFLIEADFQFTGLDGSYIFANNISLYGASGGYRNTATRNVQFLNNYDYGSLIGAHISSFPIGHTINAASWSAGVATYTTTSAHGFSIGTITAITGMSPTGYNGYYTITGVPTTTTFTVAITSDPGTAVFDPNSPVKKATTINSPTVGTMINNNIFSGNLLYGIQVEQYCDGYSLNDNHIISSVNYGIFTQSGTCSVNENRISNSGRSAIQLTAGGGYWPMDSIDISNNHTYNSGKLTTGDGINIDPSSVTPISNLSVRDNHSYDNQATATQRYGAILNSGGLSVNHTYSDNIFHGNKTAGLFLQDTSDTVYAFNNIGVNPVGKVTLGNITGSTTFDNTKGNYFTATLTGNVTAVLPGTNLTVIGTTIRLVLTQDATGSRTLTLPANAVAANGGLTLSTTASVTDTVDFTWDGTKWRESVWTPAVNTSLVNPMTTAGDIIYGGSGGSPTRLASGTTSQLLIGGTTPTWGSVVLTSMVSGTLPVANGGIGQTSLTSLPLTTPQVTTGFNDSNGNPWLKVVATTSAIGGFTITNNTSGSTVTFANTNTGNSATLYRGAGTGVMAMRPGTDSTGAFQLQQSGGTAYATFDSTNKRMHVGGSSAPTDTLQVTGNLNLDTAGNKIKITTGSNASAGTGTLSGGTVTISTTAVTASSLIFVTDTATTLTNVGSLSANTIVAGTSFNVTSTNVLDSSTFNWFLIN